MSDPTFLMYLRGIDLKLRYPKIWNNLLNLEWANCERDISRSEFTLTIRTAVNIKRGEVLTISGDIVQNFMGASLRQHSLPIRDICRCRRCLDPTELGTMLSAIKCFAKSCKSGYL